MLPNEHRLRQSLAIQRVRREGRRWHHPLFILFVAPNGQPTSRFAISVSRRLGKAVHRNQQKRRLREALRLYLPQVQAGSDCVLVARAPLSQASFAEIEAGLSQLLARAALLPGDGEQPGRSAA
jgi:ribonuclease P protein component